MISIYSRVAEISQTAYLIHIRVTLLVIPAVVDGGDGSLAADNNT
jgi:hypothetical protein